METLIARLLQDFENGKMSRRQLIQSLAMAALAAPLSSAHGQGTSSASVATPPVEPAPWKTVWLDHISFQVTDYKKSTEFYSNLMGWKVLKDDPERHQATLDINGIGGIIIRNGRRGAQGAQAATSPPLAQRADSMAAARPPRPPVNAVVDHISWGIEPWDNETVKAELVRRGLTPRPDSGGEPDMATSKFKSYHVRDPDGWDLQISNQTQARHEL